MLKPPVFKRRPQTKPRYNGKGWVLCECTVCGRHNYVEPHGMTAACPCSLDWTEHRSLPEKGA